MNDAYRATKHIDYLPVAKAEDEGIVLNEVKMGKLISWEKPGAERDRSLYYREKLAREVIDTALMTQAANRDDKCWAHTLGCKGTPVTWVYEIGFDRKEMKARLEFAQVSSVDKTGPNPGFCIAHLHQGPAMLAERVYFEQTLVQWGYLPHRWFCKMTDGSSTRGPIKQINPKMLQPEIIDTHIKAGNS